MEILNITIFSSTLHIAAEIADVLDDTVKPCALLGGRRARTAEPAMQRFTFAVCIGNSRRSGSRGDGTNEALLRRQMRPDRYTHSRLRFFPANPRCLSDGAGPRGMAATDLFQVPQTPLPLFTSRSSEKAGTVSGLSALKVAV